MSRPDLKHPEDIRLRRSSVASFVVALAVLVPASGPYAAAQPRGATCKLDGTFRPTSLKTFQQKIHYTIKGTANNCHWTDGATESGRFTARGSGSASCEQGSTTGVAHITWDNDRTSTLRFTTTNIYNVIKLDGSFTQGESKGYDAHGVLVFVVDKNEPAGCITEFGLTRATFHGVCERGKLQ